MPMIPAGTQIEPAVSVKKPRLMPPICRLDAERDAEQQRRVGPQQLEEARDHAVDEARA